jgi:hypothetical protein
MASSSLPIFSSLTYTNAHQRAPALSHQPRTLQGVVEIAGLLMIIS